MCSHTAGFAHVASSFSMASWDYPCQDKHGFPENIRKWQHVIGGDQTQSNVGCESELKRVVAFIKGKFVKIGCTFSWEIVKRNKKEVNALKCG